MQETVINNFENGNSTVINEELSDAISLNVGDVVCGKYAIQTKLDVTSGEADLFLCTYNGYTYIAKLYRRKKAIKPEVTELLKKINSNYVARIYDASEWNGYPVEIIPYFKNGSLQGKKYTLSDLKNYIIPSLNEGLHVLHDNNIIHKDLKPSNIMLADNGKDVVIIDFGISSVREDGNTMVLTRTGLTPEYVAPEAFRNLFFDITDYYSLGITIFELYYGQNPYMGMSKEDMEQFVAIQKIPIPDDMPEELKKIVTALTYPDITNRNNKLNPNRRWGYEEVKKWCDGVEQIIPGTHQEAGILSGDMLPYKFNGNIYTSRSRFILELALNWEDGKKHLFRGFLSEHFKSFDQDVANRCIDAEEAVNQNEDLVFFDLLYRIDNQFSFLCWKGKKFINLPDFGDNILNHLHKQDKNFELYVFDILGNRVLSKYLELMNVDNTSTAMKSIKSIESRYTMNNKSIDDLYRLGYLLSDSKPLFVGDDVFYSIEDLIKKVQQLSIGNVVELKKFSKKLILGDGNLDSQFHMWLESFGKQKDIDKWEQQLY